MRQVANQVPWWRSFVSWFTGLFIIVALAWMGALVAWTHMRQEEELMGKFGLVLEHIAVTAAPFVDGDNLASIENNNDASSVEFKRVRTQLQTVAEQNDLAEDQIYILRENPRNPGQYQFVVMLQERTFIGDTYDPPPAVQSSYNWVMAMKDGVRTKLYTDANGTYISGLAPVLNSDEESIAILQVDYPVRQYLDQIQTLTRNLVLVAVGFTALLLALSFVLHRRLRRRVGVLLDGTQAIEQQDYDHRVNLTAKDELGALARALNGALSTLKERVEMLKFLPRHTSEMIASAAQDGGVDRSAAKRVKLAILESDICGFTQLSSQMAPEAIISMLNSYLSVQAEVVERHNGTVDKFMGDAVLAVFLGDDQAQRAHDCA
ncbi:MAG: adenylate/guanylate cyclase domain-containing protein, partial [Planctomycetota bacterium]